MRTAKKLGLISGYSCKTTNAFRFFSFVVWYSWSSASLLYSETYKATKCKTRRLFVSIQLNFSKFLSTWLESIANCSICILQADIEAVLVLPTDNTVFVAMNWLLLSFFHYQLGTFISNAKLRTKALLLDWNSAIVTAIVLVHYLDFLCCLSLSHQFQSDPLHATGLVAIPSSWIQTAIIVKKSTMEECAVILRYKKVQSGICLNGITDQVGWLFDEQGP